MTTDKSNQSNDDLKTEVERIDSMINSPQVVQRRSQSKLEHGYIRPRNAATMILLDGTAKEPRILMGKRNKNLKFMPGALVFPGGSVDKLDGSVKSCSELTGNTENRLIAAMRGRPTRRGSRALGLAAIREVAEESGLLIGKSGDFSAPSSDWNIFSERSVVPSLEGIRLFARAITPPGLVRRFDTWFFLMHAKEVAFTPENGFEPDGELEELQWVHPEDAIMENTREITRVMLVELIRRLRVDPDLSDDYPAPYYHTVGKHFHKKMI